jgi:predicted glycosyltransferase
MGRRSTFNILMYSHDTYGLGHIRRTMAIAAQLRQPHINILILTGSPIVGRFRVPEQIDFVRIPGMIKLTNAEYRPLSIKIDARHALEIRKNIITATAKTFRPQLFIVDKEPLGLKREVLPTLRWLRHQQPETRTILGLRDVMDQAEVVRKDWAERGVYKALKELYSEIWVYGHQHFYDPVSEYAIPETIRDKIHFTGYIPRKITTPRETDRIRREHQVGPKDKLVVVTTGGGGDGYALMDKFLTMIEQNRLGSNFKSAMVTGPFMPKKQRQALHSRARRRGIRFFYFYRKMEKLLAAADLVVSMGGYNTLCEILSQKRLTLVIPRETPRREQLIRAQAFHRQNLVDYIPWSQLKPQNLGERITRLLSDPEPYQSAVAQFRLTGIEIMCQRLSALQVC